MKKTFTGILCLTSVLALAGCKSITTTKKTEKKTTTAKVTTTEKTVDYGAKCIYTVDGVEYELLYEWIDVTNTFENLYWELGRKAGWVEYNEEIYIDSAKTKKINMNGYSMYDVITESTMTCEVVNADSLVNNDALIYYLEDHVLHYACEKGQYFKNLETTENENIKVTFDKSTIEYSGLETIFFEGTIVFSNGATLNDYFKDLTNKLHGSASGYIYGKDDVNLDEFDFENETYTGDFIKYTNAEKDYTIKIQVRKMAGENRYDFAIYANKVTK